MHRKITVRSMEHSDLIEQDINKKLDKIDKFFKHEQGPVNIEVIIETHPVKHYCIVEIKIESRQYNLVARAEGIVMRDVIDEVGHKIEKDIARAKEKLVDKKHHQPKMQ